MVWEITSTSQNIDNSGSNSIVTNTLISETKTQLLVRNVFTSILFLGVLNILDFVFPANAGDKMSYCITVALGYDLNLYGTIGTRHLCSTTTTAA